MRRINIRRRIFVCVVIFFAVFSFVFLRKFGIGDVDVEAANLANFDPGYIMSDYQMSNYKSMTEEEIQSWLTSKNSCSNTDYDLYLRLSASTNMAKWHFEDGHFVCLSEELFGDGEVIGSGETAAHIIWEAAQDFQINPQVLIVLLQKENSLITDTIPNSFDYRTAAGYGCPDTAACSSKYYGFKNQVRNAAALFHEVLSGGWTNYPLGENYVRFSPHCDSGTVVNIRSLATSALYRYTPYQPNAAALAAGYATVPGSSYETCAAYGNRNFYSFFEDWFGGITRQSEAIWYEMETPRYLTVSEATSYYDVLNMEYTNTLIESGTTFYFSAKTITHDNKMCLQTKDDKENNIERCILFEKVDSTRWEWGSMETPRYLKKLDSSKVINISTGREVRDAEGVKYYDERMVLPNGKLCLRNSEESLDECVLFSTLEEISFETYNMSSPRYLAPVKDSVQLIDPVTSMVVGELKMGEKLFFTKKAFIKEDNSMCLLVETGDNSYSCARFVELAEVWMGMERPRYMIMNTDSYKIDIVSLANYYEIELPKGMIRKFVRKQFMRSGGWCLQTEYDDALQTDYCIRDNELDEL